MSKKLKFLEKGHVVSIDKIYRGGFSIFLIIDNEYYFPIGTIDEDEFSYFGKELTPEAIVYLGDNKWSYKRLWHPIDEFNKLNDDEQNNILCELLEKKS